MSQRSYRDHLASVVSTVNAHMPQSWRAAVQAEGERVEGEVLAKRGLPDRLVLIVGGAGYVGSVMTGEFLRWGYRVRCLDGLAYHNNLTVLPYLSNPNYQFMRGDVRREADVEKALQGVTDVIILAGLVGDPITKKYPELSESINNGGMAQVVKACTGKGLNKVVFVSTCSNYGLIPEGTIAAEDYELNPLSLYAKSKVAMEQMLLGARDKVDFNATVLRFSTAFGLSPRMRFDLTVSEFTRAMHRHEDLLVYDAHTWRPYCHLLDFSEVLRRVLEAPVETVSFEVFNAGGDINNFTKKMIVEAILEKIPDAPVRFQEHGTDPRNYKVNFSKIRQTLLFEPRWTVRDGIAELLTALEQGLFDDVSSPASFYGNYEVFLD